MKTVSFRPFRSQHCIFITIFNIPVLGSIVMIDFQQWLRILHARQCFRDFYRISLLTDLSSFDDESKFRTRGTRDEETVM